jgi:uncharacterized repeat protein (TIGR04138 family)
VRVWITRSASWVWAPASLCGGGGKTPPPAPPAGPGFSRALRLFAIEQFGFMAKWVLKSWGIHSTSDFGELVYNMIAVNLMRKSETDRREDFNEVFDFDNAFVREFQIRLPQ